LANPTVTDIRTLHAEVPCQEQPGIEFALVFAADEEFARATAVAVHTALECLSPGIEPEVFILDNGLAEASRDRLNKVVCRVASREIRWMEVPSEHLLDHPLAHVTPTAYARLLIPDLLPPNIRRAVYLDGDIVVKQDLSPLLQMDLGGAPLAAVRDFVTPRTDSELSPLRGLVEPKPYFNSGVLVIDVTHWRKSGVAERALGFARGFGSELGFGDQDAMNAASANWHELDFRWNVQVLMMYWPDLPRTELTDMLSRNRAGLYRDAAVLHFAGVPKPWQPYAWGTSRGKTVWARALVRTRWYKPMELVRWLLPWLGKQAIDAGRRAWPARRESGAWL
jgi:lipopolysaccharide biosynthesis glycosyltransferase